MVPNTFALIFDLTVSGHVNHFLVNNVARALVPRLVVNFAREKLQDTDAYDIYKIYEDLILPESVPKNMFLAGIQSEYLCKIHSDSADKKRSGVDKENKLEGVYGSKYRILIDHEILRDHGLFYACALADELVCKITLASANMVVKGSDPTKLGYELTNIQLEYETIHEHNDKNPLSRETKTTYLSGKGFFYEDINHHKTITVRKNLDSMINESINVSRRSIKGIMMLFSESRAARARDSEKFFNPDITKVKVTINGVPNKVYSQGLKTRDAWEEIKRHFHRHGDESNMDATKFYTEDKFGFYIDLRSMADNYLHGSGLRLVNTKDGVQLEIERKTSALEASNATFSSCLRRSSQS